MLAFAIMTFPRATVQGHVRQWPPEIQPYRWTATACRAASCSLSWQKLKSEERTMCEHWMMVYGDYLREIGYAVRNIGPTWDNISDVDA